MDIRCKQKGDTRSIRAKVFKRLAIKITSPRRDSTSEGIVYDSNEEEIEASGLVIAKYQSCQHNVHPTNIIGRLEHLVLEKKAGHDGLYDDMLDLSKQPVSMLFFNEEQLDNFIFNYGKRTCSKLYW